MTKWSKRVSFTDDKWLILGTLGKIFSKWHTEIFFLFFQENGVWHFMELFLLETICLNCQILFSRKNEKKYNHVVVCWISSESGKGWIVLLVSPWIHALAFHTYLTRFDSDERKYFLPPLPIWEKLFAHVRNFYLTWPWSRPAGSRNNPLKGRRKRICHESVYAG